MIDRKVLFGLILVLISTSYDLTRTYLNSASNETPTTDGSSSFKSHSEDELYEQPSTIPPPKITKHSIPTLKFLYCHS